MRTCNSTWTDEEFRKAASEVTSIRQLLLKLGLCTTGGSYLTVHRTVRRLGISTDHWLGMRSNRGKRKPSVLSSNWNEVLVLNRRPGIRENVKRLRQAMIASGIPEICSESECGQLPIWNGKPLRLQIDHRNGNPFDNRPGNPRFLCPNCHTQTLNYGALNLSRSKTEEVKNRRREASIREIGNTHSMIDLVCGNCRNPFTRKRKRNKRVKNHFCSENCNRSFKIGTNRQAILDHFREFGNYSETGRKFGISNTMVKKIVSKFNVEITFTDGTKQTVGCKEYRSLLHDHLFKEKAKKIESERIV